MTNDDIDAVIAGLTERCEAAASESKELFTAAYAACNGGRLFDQPASPGFLETHAKWLRFSTLVDAQAWTDAATSLFPSETEWPAVFWRSGHDGEGADPSLFFAQIMLCENDRSRTFGAVAETEALARVAAALRARLQEQQP